MTAPRLEKLRHFIHEVDRLHREHHRRPLLDAVAQRLAALVRYDDWLPEEYTLPHPHRTSSICCMPTPSASRLLASSGDRGKRRRSMTTGVGPLGCCAARRKTSATSWMPMAYARAGRRHASGSRPVEKVSADDGDIHRVSNALADRVSISIHVYGGNIGAVKRAVYTGRAAETVYLRLL